MPRIRADKSQALEAALRQTRQEFVSNCCCGFQFTSCFSQKEVYKSVYVNVLRMFGSRSLSFIHFCSGGTAGFLLVDSIIIIKF